MDWLKLTTNLGTLTQGGCNSGHSFLDRFIQRVSGRLLFYQIGLGTILQQYSYQSGILKTSKYEHGDLGPVAVGDEVQQELET